VSKSHNFEICRELFANARSQGCPTVHIMDFGNDMFVGESSDGKVLNSQMSGCCRWAMKYDIATQWLAEHGSATLKAERDPPTED